MCLRLYVRMCICGFCICTYRFFGQKNQRTLFSVIIFKAGPSSKSYVKTRDQSTKCWHERVQNKLLR